MKHIKIYERRNFRNYTKYKDILYKKFYSDLFFHIEKNRLEVYEEFGDINIEFKIWGNIFSSVLNSMSKELGPYEIYPNSGYQLTVHFTEVPKQYFKELDLELDTDKYNL